MTFQKGHPLEYWPKFFPRVSRLVYLKNGIWPWKWVPQGVTHYLGCLPSDLGQIWWKQGTPASPPSPRGLGGDSTASFASLSWRPNMSDRLLDTGNDFWKVTWRGWPSKTLFPVSRSDDVWTRFWGQITRFRSYLGCLPSDLGQIWWKRCEGVPDEGRMPTNPPRGG